MIERPALNPAYRVDVLDPEGVFLTSANSHFLLTGRLYRLLVPLIDGRRTAGELVRLLDGQADPTHLYYALEMMDRKGYVVEAEPAVAAEAAAFWSTLGVAPSVLRERLETRSVAISTVGPLSADGCVAALRRLGIRVEPRGDLDIVLADDYRREELRAINRRALRDGSPWMLARPAGVDLWLGPLFVPGETGCWECLLHRLRLHRRPELFLETRGTEGGLAIPPPAAVAASTEIGWQFAALAAARWVVQGDCAELRGTVLAYDLGQFRQERHILTRRPQCPACGDPDSARREQRPFLLQPQSAAVAGDAGTRTVGPEDTLARHGHHVSPVTGVVPCLVRTGEEHGPAHNYYSGLNHMYGDDGLFFATRLRRSGNSGKGTTETQARASALGEAIERFSGLFQGDEPRIRASYRELGEQAVHPASLLMFSERQYATREVANRHTRHPVPMPFDEARPIEWTPAWSLTRRCFRYLPTAFCYYAVPSAHEERFCQADSNGCAAGNTPEEAALQGLYELIERDAVGIWWYNRLRRPAVDLASADDPYIPSLLRHYDSLGHDLWVLDVTSDLGVPAFAAVSRNRRPRGAGEEIGYGFAAHLDPRTALLRALTEINQLLPTLVRPADEAAGKLETFDPFLDEWFATATLATDPYLAPDPQAPATRLPPRDTAPPQDAAPPRDVVEDLRHCQSLIERQGIELLVLDQTRADIGFPVVRVVAPGLRHFWPRFAPGRLYDVPVRMGWLDKPTPEEDLNPTPIVI